MFPRRWMAKLLPVNGWEHRYRGSDSNVELNDTRSNETSSLRGLAKRHLHCMFGNKSLVSSPSKTIRSPAPSFLPAKNSNCLLLIVTIPSRRWIACREEARDSSHRRCCASLKTSALRLQRTSVWPPSGPWQTSAAYAVLAQPCAACAATATSAGICR
jgi:hypothetical protein